MSLKRQFFWSMTPLLAVTVINFISVPLFLRYLGDELYALWFYVITFTGMFGFADLGLGVAVGRYIGVALGRDDFEAVREYWATGNLIAIPLIGAAAIAFAVLGVVFGPQWFNKVSPENVGLLRGCFIAGGISLFFSFYAQFWNILSQAHLDFRFASLLRTGGSLFQVVPAIAIAWITRDPFWLIVWSALSGVVQLMLFVWHARARYRLGLNLSYARMARAREMATYTAKTFISLVAGSFFVNIDRIILGRLASPAQFAHYTVCCNLGQRLQALGGSVMGPVFHNTSRTATQDDASAGRIYDEMFHFMFGWYALAILWSAAWHPVFMRLWLGAELGASAAPLMTPLVAAFCIAALASISGSQLGALNRLGVQLCFAVLAGLAAVGGVYVGWKVAGLIGAAYGYLFSRIVLIVQDVYTMRLVGARGWLNPQLWREQLMQMLIAAPFTIAYAFLPVTSTWLILPALAHAAAVMLWLLRQPLRRFWSDPGAFLRPDKSPI
jgi:O-antigen/teichoic acid export membrane protein